MNDIAYAITETSILSFLFGAVLGLQFSKTLHRKWIKNHSCGPAVSFKNVPEVKIEVHGGGGGYGGTSKDFFVCSNNPGGISRGGDGMDMTKAQWSHGNGGGFGCSSHAARVQPVTLKNKRATS